MKPCLRRLERMATGVTGEKFATGAAVCKRKLSHTVESAPFS